MSRPVVEVPKRVTRYGFAFARNSGDGVSGRVRGVAEGERLCLNQACLSFLLSCTETPTYVIVMLSPDPSKAGWNKQSFHTPPYRPRAVSECHRKILGYNAANLTHPFDAQNFSFLRGFGGEIHKYILAIILNPAFVDCNFWYRYW